MTGPPRLAEWLLRHVLPVGEAGDTIRGDLIEEWRHRCARNATIANNPEPHPIFARVALHPSGAATRWYWRQAISLAVRYAWRGQSGVRVVSDPGVRTRRGYMLAMDNLTQDVRYAVRSYLKAPSFAIAILATLALGIGASTAIFSMVNGILLRPLPLPDPDRLVFATEINTKNQPISTSVPNYFDWKARARSFETLALSNDSPQTLTGLDQARRIRARRITANFFRAIGVKPALGRDLTDDDDRANAAPAVIITDGFWKSALGGDPSIVGRLVTLNQVAYTVVGVMPPGFEYLRPYDAFVSMAPIAGSRNVLSRGNHNGFAAVGRLKPGVTVDDARRELTTIAVQLETEYPATNTGIGVVTARLADRLVTHGPHDAARALRRRRLPAADCLRQRRGPARGAWCGAPARARGPRRARRRTAAPHASAAGRQHHDFRGRRPARRAVCDLAAPPPGRGCAGRDAADNHVSIDGAALLFASAAAAICGLVFGAFPAFQAAGTQGQQALVRGRATGFAARSHHVRRGLIVVETALAIVLLVGAGLMIRTVQELIAVDTGFRADHVLTTRFALSGTQWTEDRRQAFYPEFLQRIRAIPGVTNAALTMSLPIDGSQWNSIFIVADKPVPARSQLPSAAFTPVSTGFFETMGIRLLRGRMLGAADTPASQPTIVINETLAKALWPGEDAVGKHLKQGWPEDKGTWREVVGVVADVKFNGLANDTPLQVYLPLTQESSTFLIVAARTAVDPMSIVPTLEAAARDINKDMPLFQTSTMDQVLETSIAQQRLSLIVMVTFAVVALTLAALGLYGVIAHSVTERTHEIGVRMALGAEARHVLGLMIRQGLTTTAIGAAIGVAGAVALSRWIQDLLFGVTPTDPATFAAVVATLMAVALVACYVPAWRATRVDPTMALRSE